VGLAQKVVVEKYAFGVFSNRSAALRIPVKDFLVKADLLNKG
jgi:hypothetical protein